MAVTMFKYKTTKSLLHKIPAILKLLSLLIFTIFSFLLLPLYLGAAILLLMIITFLCKFTLTEQLTDLKPAFLYAVIMYLITIFSNLLNHIDLIILLVSHQTEGSTSLLPPTLLTFLTPHPNIISLILRLTLIIQLSALFFRTTSSLEIREIVKFNTLTLFICFIPEIFNTWSSINLAWKARGGKPRVRMIKTLLFVLISISFEKAAVKAKALEARR